MPLTEKGCILLYVHILVVFLVSWKGLTQNSIHVLSKVLQSKKCQEIVLDKKQNKHKKLTLYC